MQLTHQLRNWSSTFMWNGTVRCGASANAFATLQPRVTRLSDAVMVQNSRFAVCSTHAAYVLANIMALLHLLPPLHFPLAFSTSSRLFGLILCKHIQTQGRMTDVSRSHGLARGSPNMDCLSCFVSWPHSWSFHCGRFVVSTSLRLDSFGMASPLMTASSIASAKIGSQAQASLLLVSLMFSLCCHWSSPVQMVWRWCAMTFS
jgi:hypothetical protein